MNLIKWIERETPRKVSDLLGVDINTVYAWKDLKALPRDEKKNEIMRLTKGKVTADRMIRDFFRNKADAL